MDELWTSDSDTQSHNSPITPLPLLIKSTSTRFPDLAVLTATEPMPFLAPMLKLSDLWQPLSMEKPFPTNSEPVTMSSVELKTSMPRLSLPISNLSISEPPTTPPTTQVLQPAQTTIFSGLMTLPAICLDPTISGTALVLIVTLMLLVFSILPKLQNWPGSEDVVILSVLERETIWFKITMECWHQTLEFKEETHGLTIEKEEHSFPTTLKLLTPSLTATNSLTVPWVVISAIDKTSPFSNISQSTPTKTSELCGL